MKNCLSKIDRKTLKIIETAGQAAERFGKRAYLVGGVVRDLLLKKKNLDLDIVVEGDADPVLQELAQVFHARTTAYVRFGTATLKLPGGPRLDLAAARSEVYPQAGDLPVVRPGSLKEDLFRRDFTINAMAVSLNREDFGRLIDEFGGLADLRAKKIRVLHAKSFLDDPTRIFRAIRFEQRLHFKIEGKTKSGLRAALRGQIPGRVSPARYLMEFRKMLSEAKPEDHFLRLKQLQALKIIHPSLKAREASLRALAWKIRRLPEKIGKDFYERPLLYVLALLNGSSLSAAQEIAEKFPFKKGQKKSICETLPLLGMMKGLAEKNLTRSQGYDRLKSFSLEAVIFLSLQDGPPKAQQRVRRFLQKDRHVKLAINGQDLKRLGCPAGERMGKILEKVLSSKINGKVRTKQQELEFARRLLEK